MKHMQFLPTLSLLLALIPTTMLQATENPLTYDRINLSATAQGKAVNDILVAVLYQRMELSLIHI